jgi:sugar/nucleoside kinase (ribokinase family)
MQSKSNRIIVLGSLNMDLFLEVHRMPVIGETIQTEGVVKGFGGKVNKRD